MKLDARTRMHFRLQTSTFTILLLVVLGLLAWLSTRYTYRADWTADNRHTLSAAGRTLLAQMPGPVDITAYASRNPELRTAIQTLVDRFQQHKTDFTLHFVDPAQAPGETRAQGIRADGELIIRYRERSEHLSELSETALSQVLQRLLRSREHWIVFVTGHGERDPLGQANHDLGNWGGHLEKRGLKVETLNFAETGQVPDNTEVLVLAGAARDFLPGEIALLQAYVDNGGNLLWLLEPGALHGLEPLAASLGLSLVPGTPVDPLSNQIFGLQHQQAFRLLLVTQYAPHAITDPLSRLQTLFPEPVALQVDAPEAWQAYKLFSSHAKAWSESSEITGNIEFNPGQDMDGPLDLAFAFTRVLNNDDDSERRQRVVVVGDSDFLANTYLENSGNLDLGLNLINWLTGDDDLIQIPARPASDLKLDLPQTTATLIALTFLFVLPFGLLGSGLLVWWHRRKR